MRYAICLSYDGSPFRGWQIQPKDPSVQETVEKALKTILGVDTPLVGAGRTDTSVNARRYVAHFDSPVAFDRDNLRYKLNAILPSSIVIHEIAETPGEFHARFSAKQREYTYFLHTVKDPFTAKFSFFYSYPLDFDKMNEAASMLVGTRDFSCFEKGGSDNKTSICTVTEAVWRSYTPVLQSLGEDGGNGEGPQYWHFRISADRFLRNMVRATVGTLLEVGRGKRSPQDIPGILESGDRCNAGESVPGNALFLTRIVY